MFLFPLMQIFVCLRSHSLFFSSPLPRARFLLSSSTVFVHHPALSIIPFHSLPASNPPLRFIQLLPRFLFRFDFLPPCSYSPEDAAASSATTTPRPLSPLPFSTGRGPRANYGAPPRDGTWRCRGRKRERRKRTKLKKSSGDEVAAANGVLRRWGHCFGKKQRKWSTIARGRSTLVLEMVGGESTGGNVAATEIRGLRSMLSELSFGLASFARSIFVIVIWERQPRYTREIRIMWRT